MTARKLRLSADLTLPLDVITESVGILAVKRAGKSYTAKRLAEQLLRAQQQVVVVDPKGDWWGLRSSADGQGPGFPIVILGGEHGDVPLEPSGGELVAQMVVTDRVSVILDLSELRKHQVATFMTAFLETLYRLKAKEQYRTPLMLIIDEADAIASQKPQKGEERMLGAAEDIVRRGGQRGIGVMLVTQRAAVLNKNVLTQVGILILLRTTGSQDIDAIDEWIKKHSQEASRALVMESIAALPRGTAWVWAPGWPDEHGIFQRIEVSACETFNSGATPKVGERRALPKTLADVDLDAFRREMAATIEKAKAEDPVELRKQLAGLHRELAAERKRTAAPAQTTAKDPARTAELALARVDVHALQQRAKQLTSAVERLMKFVLEINAQDFFSAGGEAIDKAAVQKAIDAAAAQLVKLAEADVGRRQAAFERWRKQGEQLLVQLTRLMEQDVKVSVAVKHNAPFTVSTMAAPRPPRPREQPVVDGAGVPLKAGARRMLQQLATFSPRGLQRSELGTLAGVQHSGGTFSDYLSALRSNGYIEERGSTISLTDAGLAAAGDVTAPQSTEEIVGIYRSKLKAGARRMLDLLVARHPEGYTRAALGAEAGVESSGGTFSDYLSSLRSAGLLDESQGDLRAAAILFLEGAA